LVLFLAAGMAGCTVSSPKTTPAPARQPALSISGSSDADGKPTLPGSITEPCADRLHTLCGPLLMYYALNHKMPERIEQIHEIGQPDPDVQINCPLSGKQYIYNAAGLPRPGKPGVLVLYDAEPNHHGRRWAVAVQPPQRPNQALIPEVVLEDEKTFQQAPSDKR
jgi:hypothetical protein